MLQSIWEAIQGIWDTIVSIVEFVIDFIKDLIYVIQLVGESVLKIPEYIGWLPTSLVTIIILIFSIVVIYKILGREG